MKELFRERDFTRVGYFESILATEGIQTFVRNRDTTMIMTWLPIPVFYPALCVVDPEDYEKAVQIIRDRTLKDAETSKTEITCPNCTQPNPGNFDTCWSCSAELTPPGQAA